MLEAIETGWIQSSKGKKIYPFDLKPDDIDIEDIALALSREPRYQGRTNGMYAYSVAQHSYYVSLIVPSLEALLHDASEAYVRDLPRPLKKWMRAQEFSFFDDVEDKVTRVICEKFKLHYPELPEVKEADTLLMITEARDLMQPLHPDWHHQAKNGYKGCNFIIVPWEARFAEQMFLKRFEELKNAQA